MNPGSEPDLQKSPNKVYDDLLAHRDVVCVPYQRLSDARYFQWCQWPCILLFNYVIRGSVFVAEQLCLFLSVLVVGLLCSVDFHCKKNKTKNKKKKKKKKKHEKTMIEI